MCIWISTVRPETHAHTHTSLMCEDQLPGKETCYISGGLNVALMLASAHKSNLKGGVLIAQVAGRSFTAVREDCGNCGESEETPSSFKRMETHPEDAGRRSQLVFSQAGKHVLGGGRFWRETREEIYRRSDGGREVSWCGRGCSRTEADDWPG